MSGARASLWDEVWAEHDARRAGVAGGPAHCAASRPARPWRLRRGPLWLGLLLALLGAYAAGPALVAREVMRADPAALAPHVDWAAVRGGLEQGLAAEAGARIGGTPLPFLRDMASELAGRLASPEGLSIALGARLGAAPRLVGLRPLGPGRWTLDLAGQGAAVRLTLALGDPLAWRWRVVAVDLS